MIRLEAQGRENPRSGIAGIDDPSGPDDGEGKKQA
jgi:hypothetical protein